MVATNLGWGHQHAPPTGTSPAPVWPRLGAILGNFINSVGVDVCFFPPSPFFNLNYTCWF